MGLFTVVRDPGVRRKLAEACQSGSSNPVLLSCAKKNGVDRQEEIAQRNPLKGFPLDSFPNRGAAFSAMRSPVPHCSPPRKDFCRAKMPCGGQVFQICCSAVKSSDFLHASRYLHARKRVLPKYVEDVRLGGHCKSGTPGISKGPRPFCFRKSPEKTLNYTPRSGQGKDP